MLSAVDGYNHLKWTLDFNSCWINYNSLACLVSMPFSISPFFYWLFWFVVIFVAMPLFMYWVTKRKDIIFGYFLFTSIPFIFDSLGFYSQFALSFFLFYLVFEKDIKKRFFVEMALLIMSLFHLIFHSAQFYFAIVALFVEVFMWVIINVDFKKNFFVLALPFNLNLDFFNFSKIVDLVRVAGYSGQVNSSNVFLIIFYYSFHFFVKPMLFIFSVPSFIHVVVSRDWRVVVWVIVLVLASFYVWMATNFSNLSVTRFFVIFPFILLPGFLEWLSERSFFLKHSFYFFGLIYFLYNLVNWLNFKGYI